MDFVQHQAGEANQLKGITSTKNSTLQNQEKTDILKSKTLKFTTSHSQKDVKNVSGRKKIKFSSKKIPPEENGNKVLFQ